jgi:hypothetical protein
MERNIIPLIENEYWQGVPISKINTIKLGLRPHATQGTRPPIKFNALFTIKNKKERFVNAEKAYFRVRGVGVA